MQSFRRRWTFEVVDESEVPREFCAIDTVKSRTAWAIAMKGFLAKVPGVRFFYVDDPVLISTNKPRRRIGVQCRFSKIAG